MVQEKEETRIFSVSKPDIKCCAINCSSGDKDLTEKFFFSFPSVKDSLKTNMTRCRKWVKKSGNIDLLSCLSSELADKFYLCSRHFPDWTAIDSTQIYIPSNAVPTYFDCDPLSSKQMQKFPVTLKTLKQSNMSRGKKQVLNDMHGESTSIQVKAGEQLIENTDSVKIEKLDVAGGNNGPESEDQMSVETDANVEKSISADQTSKDASTPTENNSSHQNVSTGMKRCLPSRKAKQGAIMKIRDINADEPANKVPRPSFVSTVQNVSNVRASDSNDLPKRVAKSSIVTNNVILKLGSAVLQHSKQRPDSFSKIHASQTISRSLRNNVRIIRTGHLATKSGESWIPVRSHLLSGEPTIFSVQGGKSTGSSPEKSVLPLFCSIGTQTFTDNPYEKREILKILNSDKKLQVFTGIPSYDVLDQLTDASLKVVMNNQAMISDIEPTMREWIILTCTKFMLSISVEALSVMFEMPEEECRKIVEKTCLFLRRTLSLPDCQKYVWVLPDKLLFGIADFSDDTLSDS